MPITSRQLSVSVLSDSQAGGASYRRRNGRLLCCRIVNSNRNRVVVPNRILIECGGQGGLALTREAV